MKKLLLLTLFAPLFANAQIIKTVAGNGTPRYWGDGQPAVAAEIDVPVSITADGSGNYYLIDGGSCIVRKVNNAGIITTFAGYSACLTDPGGIMSGDGGPATAGRLNGPTGITVSAAGKVYIADEGNKRVRMVNTAGIITTFAGNGTTGGPAGDGGQATAAQVDPVDVATDAAGNLYIADKAQNSIRRVDAATGIITTIAGTGIAGSAGDNGPATAATLSPSGMAIDTHGNIYIVNGNSTVRRIDMATGMITTIAGSGATGSTGDGGPATSAKFNHITDVAADTSGNVYIADLDNNVVRKVSTAGIITNYAGSYAGGYSGDGAAATSARLYGPIAIAMDATNGLLIADIYNHRVRKVGGVFLSVPSISSGTVFTVYPNPATAQLNITSGSEKITAISITNLIGQTVFANEYLAATHIAEDISHLPGGAYLLKINDHEITRLIRQ